MRGQINIQASDGLKIVFGESVTEQFHAGEKEEGYTFTCSNSHLYDDLLLVADKYKAFSTTSEVTL